MMEPQRLVRDAAGLFQPDPRMLNRRTGCACLRWRLWRRVRLA